MGKSRDPINNLKRDDFDECRGVSSHQPHSHTQSIVVGGSPFVCVRVYVLCETADDFIPL